MTDLDQSGFGFQKTRVYLGPSLGWVETQVQPSKTITTPGTYQVEPGDSTIFVDAGGPVTIILPDVVSWFEQPAFQPATGFARAVTVKDFGQAASFPITVQAFGGQTIDEQGVPITMNIAYQSIVFVPRVELDGWWRSSMSGGGGGGGDFVQKAGDTMTGPLQLSSAIAGSDFTIIAPGGSAQNPFMQIRSGSNDIVTLGDAGGGANAMLQMYNGAGSGAAFEGARISAAGFPTSVSFITGILKIQNVVGDNPPAGQNPLNGQQRMVLDPNGTSFLQGGKIELPIVQRVSGEEGATTSARLPTAIFKRGNTYQRFGPDFTPGDHIVDNTFESFIHDYRPIAASEGGLTTVQYSTDGGNFFAGNSAGNFTMAPDVESPLPPPGSRDPFRGDQNIHAAYNTGVGATVLNNLTFGYNNCGFGAGVLFSCTGGYVNTGMGRDALTYLTRGYGNVAIGYGAMSGDDPTTLPGGNQQRYCTAVGALALNKVRQDGNIGLGANAGMLLVTGVGNLLMGYNCANNAVTLNYCTIIGGNSAGFTIPNNSANLIQIADGQARNRIRLDAAFNSQIGEGAGANLTAGTAQDNLLLGRDAGSAITTGIGNVILGKVAGTATMSNTIIFGDGAGNTRITCDSTGHWLTAINGTLAAPAFGFAANPGLGIYAIAANRFGIATPGGLAADFNNATSNTFNGTLVNIATNATAMNIRAGTTAGALASAFAVDTQFNNATGNGIKVIGKAGGSGIVDIASNPNGSGADANVTIRMVPTGTGEVVSSGKLGYASSLAAGGSVTQGTSRTTAVTLNKACGAITLFSAAGVATYTSFLVNNTLVAANDVIHFTQVGGTNKYIILATNIVAGVSFEITFATTGGTATDAHVFNYAIIRGSVN